jgi:hypothetical protein
VGPRAGIGDPRAGVARRRDDDRRGPVRRSTERLLQVVGGDAPRVRRQIDERVDQRSAGALPPPGRGSGRGSSPRRRRRDRPRGAPARPRTVAPRPGRPGGSPRTRSAARARAARSRLPCSRGRGDLTAWRPPFRTAAPVPAPLRQSSHKRANTRLACEVAGRAYPLLPCSGAAAAYGTGGSAPRTTPLAVPHPDR